MLPCVCGLIRGPGLRTGRMHSGSELHSDTLDCLFFLTPVGSDAEKSQLCWQPGYHESIMGNLKYHEKSVPSFKSSSGTMSTLWTDEEEGASSSAEPHHITTAFWILRTVSHLVSIRSNLASRELAATAVNIPITQSLICAAWSSVPWMAPTDSSLSQS